MIALFTDYGYDGPYVGQVKLVIEELSPGCSVIDLQHDAPSHNIRASAYLLASLAKRLPSGVIVMAVVDPGVGTERAGAVVQADGRWFVGPDNGLFSVLMMRSRECAAWDITWQPERISDTFHGRDLFAPVAAKLNNHITVPGRRSDFREKIRPGWGEQLYETIYIDRFGNVMTGVSGEGVPCEARLQCRGQIFGHARTFMEVEPGQAFWYVNSIGLIELAANQCSVAEKYGLELADGVSVII